MRKKRSDALPLEVKKQRQKEATQRYIATHKEVLKERQRQRRQNDPVYRDKQNETVRLWREKKRAAGTYHQMTRNHHLRTKYGMSLEEYQAKLSAQGGVCAICRQEDPEPGKDLAVDHCHRVGDNRGLLCGRCNKGLGLFLDSPPLLHAAIEYLIKHADSN